jgi:hypothetical protein
MAFCNALPLTADAFWKFMVRQKTALVISQEMSNIVGNSLNILIEIGA